MATLPWQHLDVITPENSYMVMITYLPLKSYLSTPRFLIYIMRIYRQLSNTPGLITFSMRALPAKKKYWTLSVWKDEAAISAYISKPPHVTVMRSMSGRMGKTSFESWIVKGTDLPLDWTMSINRLANE